MSYVILGAGLVGVEAAKLLVSRGDKVRIISRSAREVLPGLISDPVDATDINALIKLEPKPKAIINALNAPHYEKWVEEFPPLNNSALEYALRTDAPIVSVSNLYMIQPVQGIVSMNNPLKIDGKKAKLRHEMWLTTMQYIKKGVKAAEVRASDYIAQGEQSPIGDRFTPVLLSGKTPIIIGRRDARHSWTAPIDVAKTAVALIDQKTFGDIWIAPTNEPLSMQQIANQINKKIGKKETKLKSIPYPILVIMGIFVPILRELRETHYQFDHDFVVDDSATREKLGITPEPWDSLIDIQLKSYLH